MFGGGGHRNAAGCRIEGTIEETRHKLLDALCAGQ
jgi:nanoRNase/pAp phosphatase (c-di-AMP/oligoRNAs hydrolase)